MLNKIVDFTLTNRWMLLAAVAGLVVAGGWALFTIPVDAFPDLTNNQVVVVTEAPSMPPSEVERLVTHPIEIAMLGLPKQIEVRSLSKLGLSMVTVVFEDSVPPFMARQFMNERLQQASGSLPQGIQPVLSPPATAFGELYQYTLEGNLSSMELKDIHEWQIKNQLRWRIHRACLRAIHVARQWPRNHSRGARQHRGDGESRHARAAQGCS